MSYEAVSGLLVGAYHRAVSQSSASSLFFAGRKISIHSVGRETDFFHTSARRWYRSNETDKITCALVMFSGNLHLALPGH